MNIILSLRHMTVTIPIDSSEKKLCLEYFRKHMRKCGISEKNINGNFRYDFDSKSALSLAKGYWEELYEFLS